MVKQKPQPKKNKNEIAFDVRTDLHQATDLLVRQIADGKYIGFPLSDYV